MYFVLTWDPDIAEYLLEFTFNTEDKLNECLKKLEAYDVAYKVIRGDIYMQSDGEVMSINLS